MTGYNFDRIVQVIENLRKSNHTHLKIVDDYNIDNVSKKILKIILSYVDYINLNVWKK